MKIFLPFALFLLIFKMGFGQQNDFTVEKDTILLNGDRIGVVINSSEKRINAIIANDKLLVNAESKLTEFLKGHYNSKKCVFNIDKFLFYPKVIIKENLVLTENSDKIGSIVLRSDGEFTVVEVYPAMSKYFDFLDKKIRPQLQDYFEKQYSVNSFMVHIKEISARVEFVSLDEKLVKYNQFLAKRLAMKLDEVEGLYSSIDFGVEYEFDVVVLKSVDIDGVYDAWVVSTTDPDFNPDYRGILFTIKETAVENNYLISFSLKSGADFNKKLAVYNNGFLNYEKHSFIKMYPSKEEKVPNFLQRKSDWKSSGSGFYVNEEGYLLTNYHVVDGASKITVTQSLTGETHEAKVVLSKPEFDIVLLKVDDIPKLVNNISLASMVKLGQRIITLGYPISATMGENIKISEGIVSGNSGPNNRTDYFQTSLPVWYGNSGGPCYNEFGQLVGIISEIQFDENRGVKVENVSYATGLENIKEVLKEANIELPEVLPFVPSYRMDELIEILQGNNVFIKVYGN